MGKTVAYVAAAVVFLGIGALVAGLIIWYNHPNIAAPMPSESRYAQCRLAPSGSNIVEGTLYLEQSRPDSPVLISGEIKGLTEGPHGFHVHQWGVAGAENGCTDAGGHYNPMGYNHAAPNATERHVGDLGNVMATRSTSSITNTTVDIKDSTLTLWNQYSIVGRAIVVHAKEDDLGLGGNDDSLKTGNAGGRVACCTIYLTSEPGK